ncbi:hypothetical protein GCM10011375_10150 [Hymenobacter qilianensis]|uniref:Uncharacterized protein n=2 Tax=Hymenobacter qilianensis TaxID=1385715 RepID=A0ACB5PP15_9BACT|nr:hypothetical protein [Hymenobacter qilianensis]QNP53387.1 hypothetical protein H9L05_07265 [Hymenobacter qilianensis]GGF56985.1 hypothetical protein GCM10011375_10150 [Hymenobacter qilianensis]
MAKKPVKKKKNDPEKKARVHKDLEGFEIKINPLGEITSTYTIEEVNQFLNRHVRDKKLVNRDGQFGEKIEEDEEFPLEEGTPEPEETEEEFMRRTSREAKKPKKSPRGAADDSDEEEMIPTTESPE